ncbi:MAG: GTP cyclohydrolase II [Rhodospirillales bacterium]|nr:GTP cyclohydrolase II [Rhodospirillales bacterium]
MTSPLRDQRHFSASIGAHSPVSSGPEKGPASGSALDAPRLRAVHRAVAELRRGTPVLLSGPEPLILLAAETAGARGLGEFAALAAQPAALLLAPSRAAGLLRRADFAEPPASGAGAAAVALRLTPALATPAMLASMADPTLEQLLTEPPALLPAPVQSAAALALAKLARLLPAVLAAPPGPMAEEVAARLSLLRVPAADVLAYPQEAAAGLRRVAEAAVPLEGARDARIVAFRTADSGIEHLAIVIGAPQRTAAPLVRLHSECFTGDLLGSLRCDCGTQLRGAIRRMAEDGAGVLLYLAQEGRGIGLVNKLRAYALQDRGLDTVDANRALGWGADERNFMVAAVMLRALDVHRIRLLTNNPEKVQALAACGIEVAAREAHAFAANGVNDQYLATKAARFGHLLDGA